MNHKHSPALDAGHEIVELYLCEGEVFSIAEFCRTRLATLSEVEAAIITEALDLFPPLSEIPDAFRRPLSRSKELATTEAQELSARRSGARSAYFPESGLQLKACRPVTNDETFPIELLALGETQITHSRIPFGTMTEEAVLREVLGYCFMKRLDNSMQATPLAVTRYNHEGRELGYGMLLRLQSEERLESHLDTPEWTIGSILYAQIHPETGTGEGIVGSELRLLNLNLWKCMENNARILAEMHWNGGFRGILNSNLGNTVLVPEEMGNFKIALADFDTFTVWPTPSGGAPADLDAFVLQCLVEVCMGSLPIMQYVDLPTECPLEQAADALGAVYFSKSSLWRSYYRNFLAHASERGINTSVLVDSIERMRQTPAFVEILGCRVLTGESVRRSTLQFYYPHN